MSRSILLRMRSVSDKNCRDNHNTHFMFSKYFDYLAVYEIMWNDMVETDRSQMTIWRMRIAVWITKAKTHNHAHALIIYNN
jgi:hypothetical protein